MDIGQRVRALRKAAGLTQEDMAHRAGVTFTSVNRLERGRSSDPHYSTLQGLAAALNITVEQLVKEDEGSPVALKADAPTEEAGHQTLEAAVGHEGEYVPVPTYIRHNVLTPEAIERIVAQLRAEGFGDDAIYAMADAELRRVLKLDAKS